MQEVRVKRTYKCQESLQVSGHQVSSLWQGWQSQGQRGSAEVLAQLEQWC